MALLDSLRACNVRKIVFSSTAAVYGEPEKTPITEDMATCPTNVYGRTKLIIEGILADYDRAYGLSYVSLRYFNAAGAIDGGDIGEDHAPESHLVPLILKLPWVKERLLIFTALITPRLTAPVFAITFMFPIWRLPMFLHWSTWQAWTICYLQSWLGNRF